MSKQTPFDPYYKWLGIPPAEQPANFYRLLSLDVFENDPEIIAKESAAPFAPAPAPAPAVVAENATTRAPAPTRPARSASDANRLLIQM